ncbi:30S ribosomal protein S4 [Staphylococcus gallinarum]|nr:30S ribosomal protein S4 [Staphylococcus gallinarum]
MTERQFRNTFETAGKQHGVHGENFMQLLAARLDAVVYALGLARTRRQARQLVNHGHVEVDGKRVDIPSYTLKPGQEISVREKSQKLDIIAESVEINNFVPDYLEFDADNLKGKYIRVPERSELPAEINEQLIVEYYSR